MNFSIVAAIHHSNRAIGSTNNSIPWSCKEDMRFFRKLTMHTEDPNKVNAVIMGSTTWTSMGCKPLPNRLNIVLSRKMAWMERSIPENVMVCCSLDEALDRLLSFPLVESVFVIGGQNVYEQALLHPNCVRIFLNQILCPLYENTVCNTFFPPIDKNKYQLLETKTYDTYIQQLFIQSN